MEITQTETNRTDRIRELLSTGKGQKEIGNLLGISDDAVFREVRKLRHQAELGALGYRAPLPGFSIKQTSQKIDDVWIKHVKEPGAQFEVPEGQSIKGVSALVDADGREMLKWIKTRSEEQNTESIIEAVKSALIDFDVKAPVVAPPTLVNADLATIYICADWHIGLLSWHKETGTNYDLKIAKEQITEGVNFLVGNSPASEQAVVLGLGDLTHTDGFTNRTEKSGNQLDVDGRWPRVLRAATYQMRETINKALAHHDRVLARILPGNHDEKAALSVALALELHYENEPRVTIDSDPSYFWWWEWGKSLIGATHGDRAKMADLPLIMASRNPKAWGRTKFRYIHTGHIHTQTGIEKSGVSVESHQTPVASDAWHHQMGYGAQRSMTSITLHKERGEIGRTKANII